MSVSRAVLCSLTAALAVCCLSTLPGVCQEKGESAPAPGPAPLSPSALNPVAQASRFRVLSAQDLRAAHAGPARIQITGPGERPISIPGLRATRLEPNLGCPDYASGSGVVLRPLRPWHEGSGSTLILRGVYWNEGVRRRVIAGEAEGSFTLAVAPPYSLGTNVYFQGLPSAQHTYVFTLGTSTPVNRVRIRVGNRFLAPTELVANPANSEIRAMFSYEAGRCENRLAIYVQYYPEGSVSELTEFHHAQLARLD